MKCGNQGYGILMRVAAFIVAFSMAVPWGILSAPSAYAEDAGIWDGTSVAEPVSNGGVYEISSGAELAWLSEKVNSGDGKAYKVKLTKDIDLGSNNFQPIGTNYSYYFGGSFDGGGHSITGLKVQGGSYAQAALFGYIKGAKIESLIVKGTVAGENSAVGGVVSRSEGASVISEVGSEIDVKNTASSGKAAGIAGWADDNVKISRCYNKGSIESGDRASGIVADTGTQAVITDSYNLGNIKAAKANGIGSSAGIEYVNCYNAGKLTGSTSSYGIGASNYAEYTNTYYLKGTAANSVTGSPAPVEMGETDMKKASFAEAMGSSWKADSGLNGGFPVLSWEDTGSSGPQKLEAPSGLTWNVDETTEATGVDKAIDSFDISWNAVDGAEGYVVKLYDSSDMTEPLFVTETLDALTYDLYGFLKDLDVEGVKDLRFTVTSIGDGTAYEDSDESRADTEGYSFDADSFIGTPERITWNEASGIAVWEAVPGAESYIVTLYRGNKEVVETILGKKVIGSNTGNLSAYFLNNMAQSGEYHFTVMACRKVTADGSPNKGKVVGGKLAKSDAINRESIEGETISITSAEQWMEIVNMEAAGTEYMTDADRQRVEWSKNYVLENDIDFSGLTTEDNTLTKSWGNIDAPFSGTFDGNGHKITGLTLSNSDAGLFEYIGKTGVVKNLTVEAANLLVSDNAAVFAHYNYGKMQNCHVRNTNITTDYAGVIGPMASRNFGVIEGCTVQGGKLIARTSTSNGHSGFVGNNTGTVKKCWTSMDVTTGSYNAGGFCGWSDQSYELIDDEGNTRDRIGTFEDCFALGNVSAVKGWSGGFIGRINSTKNTFKNCYVANTVTSEERPERCYGFVGSFGSEGLADINGVTPSFVIDPPDSMFSGCYYASDLTASDNPKSATKSTGKLLAEMRTSEFSSALGMNWAREGSRNAGLPYLSGMPVPEKAEEKELNVSLAIAVYDKNTYSFERDGDVISITMPTTGNTCVIDVMDEAVRQGLLTYDYTITPAYGSFIEAINGNKLSSPDGWMFTVNDDLSDVSASIRKVEEGDQILWYQGTTQNLFAPPSWKDITGEKPKIEWQYIRTPEDLVALTEEDADLTANYRLANDIDMKDVIFSGIGRYGHPFAGVFDGQGHEIKNVKIDRPEDHNIGFFNFIKGSVIKNLTLTDVDITAKYSVGGMVGVADAEVNVNDRAKSIGNNIGGCRVTGKVTSVNTDQSAQSDGSYAGGFIGFNNGETHQKTGISVMSSIDDCEADVEVSAGSHYSGAFAGGNYGYITNSRARGQITGAKFTGGFTGGNEAGIYDSAATGDVTGKDYTGGFSGSSNGTIERSYSTGKVTGSIERIGGFLGSGSGAIKRSASSGTVDIPSSASYTGGFAGYYSGTLTGLEYMITFSDNYGWCEAADGTRLYAIGNNKSSTNETEQAALDSFRVTEWPVMQERFMELFGLILTDRGEIVVPKKEVDLDLVAEGIYKGLPAHLSDREQAPWIISDMVMYEDSLGKSSGLSDEEKQAYIESVAEAVQETGRDGKLSVSAGDLAKYIISFRALGYDPEKIIYKGGEDTLDMVSMLKEKTAGDGFKNEGVFTQPYILIALSMDPSYATDAELKRMSDVILSERTPGGGWGSADATGPCIIALTRLERDQSIDNAMDEALSPSVVIPLMDSNGAVSSVSLSGAGKATSESTALMVAAIVSAGKDPEAYVKDGASMIDGLKSFVNDAEDGFEHDYNKTGSRLIATEQGLRAVLAMMLSENGKSLYDFAGKPKDPAVTEVERIERKDDDKPDDGGDDEEANKKALLDKKESARKEIEEYLSSVNGKADKGKAVELAMKAVLAVALAEDPDSIDNAVSDFKRSIDKLEAEYKPPVGGPVESHISKAKALKIKGFKVKYRKKKKALITWKKNSGATGYQIYRATKKKGKYIKVAEIRSSKITKKVNKKLKKGKKYFYKMRTFTDIGGIKYYGKWTKIRKIKVKK